MGKKFQRKKPTSVLNKITCFRELIKLVRLYSQRYKQRQELKKLSDFMLKDIGITKADALREANKPFWKK